VEQGSPSPSSLISERRTRVATEEDVP
jgi:hypothetical protein